MNYSIEKNTSNTITNILVIVVFILNLSQLPIFLNNGMIKIVTFFSWLILLYFIFISKGRRLNVDLIKYLTPLFLFDILMMIFEILTGNGYLQSEFIYPIHLSAFIFTVAFFLGQCVKENIIHKIAKSYIFSSLIVSLVVYIQFFKGKSFFANEGYLYTSKNSLAISILISLLLILIVEKKLNTIKKVILSAFFTFMIIIMQSRTSILCGIIAIIYNIIFIKKSIIKKLLYTIILLIIIIMIFNNDYFRNIIMNNIMNIDVGSNINSISSGRIEQYSGFAYIFRNNYLIGNGGIYIESFPLSVIASYGIIIGFFVFIFSLIPFIILIRYRKIKKYEMLRKIILLIGIIMLINSLFEQLSPFGPGAKCYTLWLFTGIYLGLIKKIKMSGGVEV